MTSIATPPNVQPAARRRAGLRTAVALVATAALMGACSSDGESDEASDEAEVEQPAEDSGDESGGGDAAADDGGSPPDNVGSGVVRIDGVENAGFVGDCEISRNFGADDVGDLSSTDELSVIVAVDNVESQPAEELNFVMLNPETFRVVNAPGTIDSISESGTRTSSGSRDYTTVVFAGALDDGRAVEAELLCELQNQF